MKTIHRKLIREKFTTIPNSVIQDKSLSFKARGILVMMLSMPDDWQTYQSWIEEQSAHEGAVAIRKAIVELTEAGYLRREVTRDKGRITKTVWHWTDSPECRKSPRGILRSGETHTTKNPSLQNTDSPKSKESKEDSLAGDGVFPANWKPNTKTKAQQLASIRPPTDYPTEGQFDNFLAHNTQAIPEFRPDLYQFLCMNKWHHWKEQLRKWVPIRDWESYVVALDDKMLQTN